MGGGAELESMQPGDCKQAGFESHCCTQVLSGGDFVPSLRNLCEQSCKTTNEQQSHMISQDVHVRTYTAGRAATWPISEFFTISEKGRKER